MVDEVDKNQRGPVRGGLYVPRLNFKPFHFAISEGSHVAVGISFVNAVLELFEANSGLFQMFMCSGDQYE